MATTKKTLVIVTTKYTYIAWFQQRTFTLVTAKNDYIVYYKRDYSGYNKNNNSGYKKERLKCYNIEWFHWLQQNTITTVTTKNKHYIGNKKNTYTGYNIFLLFPRDSHIFLLYHYMFLLLSNSYYSSQKFARTLSKSSLYYISFRTLVL